MIAIKFEKPEQESLQNYLRDLIGDRLSNQILGYLDAQTIEVVHGWTEERVAVRLFSEAEKNYWTYGNRIMAYLPEGFLESCLRFVDSLNALNDESLSPMLEEVACEGFNEEIFQYAYQWAEKGGDDRPSPEDISENINDHSSRWLEHIVHKAIAGYTGNPIMDVDDKDEDED